MEKFAILAPLEARPDEEQYAESFLKSALPVVTPGV
jgi:hypothetical protein